MLFEKINHRKARRIMWLLYILGFAVMFIAVPLKSLGAHKIVIVIGGCVLVSGVIFGVIFLRCPFCHAHFNMYGFSPDFCPNCGKKI